jgi:hypothetical protein
MRAKQLSTSIYIQTELSRVINELKLAAVGISRGRTSFPVRVNGTIIEVTSESQALRTLLELIKLYAGENISVGVSQAELAPVEIDSTRAMLDAA